MRKRNTPMPPVVVLAPVEDLREALHALSNGERGSGLIGMAAAHLRAKAILRRLLELPRRLPSDAEEGTI